MFSLDFLVTLLLANTILYYFRLIIYGLALIFYGLSPRPNHSNDFLIYNHRAVNSYFLVCAQWNY